jgi:hypothetical protein
MITLVAACITALVVLPRLWWSRGPRPAPLYAMPARKSNRAIRFAGDPGLRRDSALRTLEPAVRAAV